MVLLVGFVARAGEGAVSITVSRNAVGVSVALNGAGPYSFVLDLGAPHPVVDAEVAAFLNFEKLPVPAVEARGFSGEGVRADVVRIERFAVGDAMARDVRFLAMDLGPLTALFGERVSGVFSGRELGAEAAVDLAGRTLTLRRASEALVVDDRASNTVSMVEDAGGVPTVSAVLNGRHVRPVVIDTTFGGTVGVSEPALRELGLLTADTPRLTLAAPCDGVAMGETQIRLERVRVGGAEVLEPVCVVLGPGEAPRLGLGFLRHITATVNFERGLLRLRPGAKPPLRDPGIVGFGLSPARWDGGAWRVWVAQGSPAARAGFASGDVLEKVDDQSVAPLSYGELAARLEAQEGDGVTVTLSRRGGPQTATLVAERLL